MLFFRKPFAVRAEKPNEVSGLSLIEVVVAIGVLLVAVGTIFVGLRGILIVQQRARVRTLATALANEQLEIARNLPYQDVGIIAGIPLGVLPRIETVNRGMYEFTVTRTIRSIDDPFDGTIGGNPNDLSPGDNKLVEIAITCALCPGFDDVTLTTTVAPRNLETAAGNGALFVQVFDASGQPIPQANVHIENAEFEPAIVIDEVTNNNGILQIVDAPPSLEAYHIVVTKAGYTVEQTYPPGEPLNPNPAKPDATVVVGAVTQVSFAIDLVSTVNVVSVSPLCVPVGNFDFHMQGNKLIGTNPDVLKYSQDLLTNGGGLLTLTNMEWASYGLTGIDAAYDIAGTIPTSPFSLFAGATQALSLILEPQTAHRLLVTVRDQASLLPLADANVRLTASGFDESQLSGQGSRRQTNWSGGSGQTDFVDQTRYFDDDGNVNIGGVPGDVLLRFSLGAYVPSAVLTSSTFDMGQGVNFASISFRPLNQPPETGPQSVRLQVATNTDNATWNFLGPDGTAATYYDAVTSDVAAVHDGDRYFRYRLFLGTDDTAMTPNVSDVTITFVTACAPPGQVFFSGLVSQNYTLEVSKAGYTTSTTNFLVQDWVSREVLLSP